VKLTSAPEVLALNVVKSVLVEELGTEKAEELIALILNRR
jgi:hypothetical protein